MRPMRVSLLVALGAALLAAPAAAQSTDSDAALSRTSATEPARAMATEPVRMDDAPRPLPMQLLPSGAAMAEVGLDASIVSHRPWWRIPLYGAVLGLGVGLLAPNCSEGGDHTVCIPPEAIGVVLGGAMGLVVEGLMQSWVDHRAADSSSDDPRITMR
jgi:hypothetical protein